MLTGHRLRNVMRGERGVDVILWETLFPYKKLSVLLDHSWLGESIFAVPNFCSWRTIRDFDEHFHQKNGEGPAPGHAGSCTYGVKLPKKPPPSSWHHMSMAYYLHINTYEPLFDLQSSCRQFIDRLPSTRGCWNLGLLATMPNHSRPPCFIRTRDPTAILPSHFKAVTGE